MNNFNPFVAACLSVILLSVPLQTFAKNETEDPVFEKHCSGYGRAGYIRTDVENNGTEKAFALGGEFGCGFAITHNIDFRLGLSTALDPGVNSDDDIELHSEFFDANKDSYVLFSESVLNAYFDSFEIHLGRQIFDSPHMDSDDLRMVPNRFETYQLIYSINDSSNLGFAYVRQMSGWENGNDLSEFVEIGKAFGTNDGAAYVGWATFELNNLSVQIWDYVVDDIENIFYAEAVYTTEINEDWSWELALQYDQGREIGSEKLGNIDADTIGAGLAVTYKFITLSIAHNRNFGDSGALPSLGGGPFFTSMEDQTLDAVTGSDARATTIGVEAELLDGLVLGYKGADFRASNKSDYHVRENHFYLNYEYERLNLFAIYADSNDRNSADDQDQMRIILTYLFDGPI